MDGASTVRERKGLADEGLVGTEILLGDDPPLPQNVARDPARQLPLVEEACPLFPNSFQGVGELWEPDFLTQALDPVSGVEVFTRLVGEPENLFRDLEPHGAGLAQLEPLAGEPDGRDERLPQGEPAVPAQQ